MILAIESTCDETGAAVVEISGGGVRIVSNVLASSANLTEKYGGVVPEVVAREQVAVIIPVIKEALTVTRDKIEAVVVANEPGLAGSLLVGIETAKTIAFAWNKPLIRVNHIEAHLMANWIVGDGNNLVPIFPALGLVVSGGHTKFYLLNDMHNWVDLGGTRDDAAGEAFDKGARLLGLPYPGGPAIQAQVDMVGAVVNIPDIYKLPRPMIGEKNLEMSFSGLKSALAKVVSDNSVDGTGKSLLAWEFNQAIVEVLVKKATYAVNQFLPKSFLLAGGVAANRMLRECMQRRMNKLGVNFFMPELRYCTDNAAMVGAAGMLRCFGL